MKKFLTSVLLASIAFFGCKKEVKEVKQDSMEYSINGLSSLTYKYAKLNIPVEVKHLSGPQESVNLSITGLPAGMKSTLSTTSGTPTFGTFLELTNTTFVEKGTYPIKFTTTTSSGKSKSIDFNLLIENKCSEYLSGNYSNTGTVFEIPNIRVYNKNENPNRIYFYDEGIKLDMFYGDVDCSKGTITIPSQSANGGGSSVSGAGTFTMDPNNIILNLKFVFSATLTIDEVFNCKVK